MWLQILVQDANGAIEPAAAGPVRTLRGRVLGDPDSLVAGSLLADGLYASVRLSSGASFWIEPAGAAYAVYRDGEYVTTVTTPGYEDTPPENGTFLYGVVALGDAGTARARSMTVAVQLDDVPPSNGDGDGAKVVHSTCDCRTVGAPLFWLLLIVPLWRRRR